MKQKEKRVADVVQLPADFNRTAQLRRKVRTSKQENKSVIQQKGQKQT